SGNSVADFTATALDTQNSANAYANRLQFGQGATGVSAQVFDDLFWQSGASTGSWLGDIRCYARMPASDASVTFSKSPASVVITPPPVINTTVGNTAGYSRYTLFTASFDGAIGSATVSMATGYT